MLGQKQLAVLTIPVGKSSTFKLQDNVLCV